MATTYQWLISQLQCYPQQDGLTDVVIIVHWRRQAENITDNKTYFAESYSTLTLAAPDPANFTPYADLTKAQVDGWLDAAYDVAAIDASLDQQIQNEINPPVIVLPLPWQQPNI